MHMTLKCPNQAERSLQKALIMGGALGRFRRIWENFLGLLGAFQCGSAAADEKFLI